MTHEEALIFFVKHLVQITARRNAFYVALGVERVIHDYTTAETMKLYSEVLAGHEPVKGEDYFRARKARLMREIQARFGQALRVVRGPRGEERFEAEKNNNRHAHLVLECLDRFTPWGTACSDPAGRDGHELEIGRMHTILHPACNLRLAERLGLDRPEGRLRVPFFSLVVNRNGGAQPPSGRGRPPRLNSEERLAAQGELDELSSRRKRSSAGLLRVEVDRQLAGFLDVERERKVRIEVNEDAELIEVIDPKEGGGTPLAVCVLPLEIRDAVPARLSIVPEGGQRLSFEVRAGEAAGEERGTLVVEIRYEPGVALAVSSLLRAVRGSLGGIPWKLALGFGLLLALGLGLALSRWSRRAPPVVPLVAAPVKAETAPVKVASPTSPTPAEQVAAAPSRESGVTRPPVAVDLFQGKGRREMTAEPEILTREVPAWAPATALTEVRAIAIETSGAAGPGEELEARIQALLKEGGRFAVTENREAADALLKIDLRYREKELLMRVELLDSEGRRLWPEGSRRAYRGDTRAVAEKIFGDLERAVSSGTQKPQP